MNKFVLILSLPSFLSIRCQSESPASTQTAMPIHSRDLLSDIMAALRRYPLMDVSPRHNVFFAASNEIRRTNVCTPTSSLLHTQLRAELS